MRINKIVSLLLIATVLFVVNKGNIAFGVDNEIPVVSDEAQKVYEITLTSKGTDTFTDLSASHSLKNGTDFFSSRYNGGYGGGDSMVHIFGLDPKTGKQKFENVYNDNAYGQYLGPAHDFSGEAPNTKQTTFALDDNGRMKWKVTLPELFIDMKVDGNFYYFRRGMYTDIPPEVIKYSRNGKLLWKYTYQNSPHYISALHVDLQGRTTIFFDGYDGAKSKIVSLTKDGKKKFGFFLDKDYGPAYSGTDQIYGPDGSIYFKAANSSGTKYRIYALNPNGTLKWSKQTGILQDVQVATDGTVFFVEFPGNGTPGIKAVLRAYSPAGKELWSYQRPYNSNSNYSIILSDYHTVYFDGNELDLNGKHIRSFLNDSYSNAYDSISIATDGTLFLFKELNEGGYWGGDPSIEIEKYKLKYPIADN